MSANLRFEGNIVRKDSFTINFKISGEHSNEIFKAFGGILLKVVVFYC